MLELLHRSSAINDSVRRQNSFLRNRLMIHETIAETVSAAQAQGINVLSQPNASIDLRQNLGKVLDVDPLNEFVRLLPLDLVPVICGVGILDQCAICFDYLAHSTNNRNMLAVNIGVNKTAEGSISLRCGHKYCGSCLLTLVQSDGRQRSTRRTVEIVCPLCRRLLLFKFYILFVVKVNVNRSVREGLVKT